MLMPAPAATGGVTAQGQDPQDGGLCEAGPCHGWGSRGLGSPCVGGWPMSPQPLRLPSCPHAALASELWRPSREAWGSQMRCPFLSSEKARDGQGHAVRSARAWAESQGPGREGWGAPGWVEGPCPLPSAPGSSLAPALHCRLVSQAWAGQWELRPVPSRPATPERPGSHRPCTPEPLQRGGRGHPSPSLAICCPALPRPHSPHIRLFLALLRCLSSSFLLSGPLGAPSVGPAPTLTRPLLTQACDWASSRCLS